MTPIMPSIRVSEAIIKIVFVCPHTYLPIKKPWTPNVFIELLKKM